MSCEFVLLLSLRMSQLIPCLFLPMPKTRGTPWNVCEMPLFTVWAGMTEPDEELEELGIGVFGIFIFFSLNVLWKHKCPGARNITWLNLQRRTAKEMTLEIYLRVKSHECHQKFNQLLNQPWWLVFPQSTRTMGTVWLAYIKDNDNKNFSVKNLKS